MNIKVISDSSSKTADIGKELGKQLKGNEIICLSGDLGAGKTLLTKGIATALGVDAEQIVSPTFTLMNHYKAKFNLFHYDLYRFENISASPMPEIDDYLDEGVLVIEWAQYLWKGYFESEHCIDINIIYLDENRREIVINSSPDYIVLSD